MKCKHGRAILISRDNEIAAEASGVNTTYYKTCLCFLCIPLLVQAAFTRAASALWRLPSLAMKSVEILVMVVLGGMGSMFGSVVRNCLTVLPEALRAFADYRMVAYIIVLILVAIFRP